MEPDVALQSARSMVAAMKATADDQLDSFIDAAEGLQEAFEALDGWLSHGGFPPKAWTQVADPGDTNRA